MRWRSHPPSANMSPLTSPRFLAGGQTPTDHEQGYSKVAFLDFPRACGAR